MADYVENYRTQQAGKEGIANFRVCGCSSFPGMILQSRPTPE